MRLAKFLLCSVAIAAMSTTTLAQGQGRQGRQGRGGRTHLVSPAMAAAAAVSGHLADVRDLT